jgi:hypothetical protein
MLDRLVGNVRASALLASVFDFDIKRLEHAERVSPAWGRELHPVAGDASGGTSFVCGGHVLYASSEGTGGIISADLTTAVHLVIGMPTWQDVAVHAPDLDAIRAAFESSHAELSEHEPDINRH